MNSAELLLIYPFAKSRVEIFAPLITQTMIEFAIDTPQRQAAFLAQVGHESGQLRYTEEIASGAAYENRDDLGNTEPGDGRRFKGRGLIQVTGRTNYRACGIALGVDLLADPTQLARPDLAARSAGWFWKANGLNRYADVDHFGSLTKRVNGGYNGLDDRIVIWLAARRVLRVS
jgi:putative chitinase